MCQGTRRVVDPVRLEPHCADCGLVFDSAVLVADVPLISAQARTDGTGRGIGPFIAPGTTRKRLGSLLIPGRDAQGHALGWHRRYEFEHLKRVMQRQTSRTADGPLDRSQARAALAQCGDALGVPAVIVGEAERIFVEARAKGLFRGRSLPACVGAAAYAACRRFSVPRTLGEVAKAAGGRRSEVGRAFKLLRRGVDGLAQSVDTRAFLQRYAEELALSGPIRTTAEAMLGEAQQNAELSGISPHGLVAALIYLAAERHGERRTRAQVARVGAVTEVTLRSTSRLVERILGPRA